MAKKDAGKKAAAEPIANVVTKKKIAVLGTGANGSCTAADLTRSGHDVVLIDQWPAHVEAMRSQGLRITMPEEELHVAVRAYHLCDVASLNTTFDIVLLLVKAYDTRWMTAFIEPYLAKDGLLVGMQNAMTADDIVSIVGPSRTIGCVVELSSEIFTPGLVQRNTPPNGTWFGVGSMHPSTAGREEEIAALLRHVGSVSITSDVLSGKWMKLIINSMCLAPAAMVGVNVQKAFKLPGMRELAVRAGTEALSLGQRLGYKIEPIIGLNANDLKDTNQLLEKMLDKITADVGPNCRDCVFQDHLKGRYSEADAINGMVAAQSRKFGQDAPVNAAIAEISRRIHAGELKPDVSNYEEIGRMLRS